MTVFGRLWRTFCGLVHARIRNVSTTMVEQHAPPLAGRMFATAAALARLPFRDETVAIPSPLTLNGAEIDVVADLAAFTGLPIAVVKRELTRRSFRSEWHATPNDLRADHWYYLSAKGYLFANAVHFPDRAFVDEFVRPHLEPPARILDFGAGTANLSLTLATAGFQVAATELNALQRDFIRFRVNRHALDRQLEVLDWWSGLPRETFDAIVAVDVLEHLEDAPDVLDNEILPALKAGGILVENSPFVVNVANPMHHEDFGLADHLEARGLTAVATGTDGTRVWRGPR